MPVFHQGDARSRGVLLERFDGEFCRGDSFTLFPAVDALDALEQHANLSGYSVEIRSPGSEQGEGNSFGGHCCLFVVPQMFLDVADTPALRGSGQERQLMEFRYSSIAGAQVVVDFTLMLLLDLGPFNVMPAIDGLGSGHLRPQPERESGLWLQASWWAQPRHFKTPTKVSAPAC